MTSAQQLAQEVGGLMVSLGNRLGPGGAVTAEAREEHARATRTLTALGALMGIAPVAEISVNDVRPGKRDGGERCPRCNEKLKLTPTAGFGTSARMVCGACGYDPNA